MLKILGVNMSVFCHGFYHYAPVDNIKITLDDKDFYRFIANRKIKSFDSFSVINKVKSNITTGNEYVLAIGNDRVCVHTY